MRNKSMGIYIIYSITGFILISAGVIFTKLAGDSQGIIQVLPYALIGIGAGIFGQNLGTVFNISAVKKDPKMAKQKEIEEKDERNTAIRNKAKAKSYDLMVTVFGVLMMVFAFMQVNWTVVIALVIAYLFVIFSNIYFISKYGKEM